MKILLALIIFSVSVATYCYPVYKKGYPTGADYQNLIEARNFALSGTYLNEDAKGVSLSSDNAQNGSPRGIINPLTPIIYGQIFKYLGFKPQLPLYLSIVLFSLFNVLIFLIVAKLFGNILIGFISGSAGAFMPIMTIGAMHGGFYEWGILFFGLALWSYLGSKNGPFQAGKTRILTASILFALAALSRNAFAVSFIPFFLYDFLIHKSYKRSLIFLLPFIIIFGSTLTSYSWLGVPNGYNAGIEQQSFGFTGHVFPDPYTLHFNKDNFIKEMYDKGLGRTAVAFAKQWGFTVSLSDKLKAHLDSFIFYIEEEISLTSIGGPVIWGLIILGIFRLYSINKKLLGLFLFWWFLWIGYLVYDETGNWDHLMEIMFIFSTLIGLGLYYLIEILNKVFPRKIFIAPLVFILFIGHLAYANFWGLHDAYRSSRENVVLDFANKIKNWGQVGGVYAIGTHPANVYSLNYHINHDTVYFDPGTIENLISAKKLKEAFGIYDITAVLGYGEDLTKQINSLVSVRSIP